MIFREEEITKNIQSTLWQSIGTLWSIQVPLVSPKDEIPIYENIKYKIFNNIVKNNNLNMCRAFTNVYVFVNRSLNK